MAAVASVVLVLLGILLAVLLVFVTPASMLTRSLKTTPEVVATAGSLGTGRLTLAGGYQLNWASRTVLWPPHLATDLTFSGADTRITGQMRSGFGGIALRDLSGRAGPGLAQFLPGGGPCDLTATLTQVAARWGWRRTAASGTITTQAGRCRIGNRVLDLPPLTLALSTNDGAALLALRAAAPDPLATMRIRRDRVLDITITPAAADVFPQVPRGGPITLQLPF